MLDGWLDILVRRELLLFGWVDIFGRVNTYTLHNCYSETRAPSFVAGTVRRELQPFGLTDTPGRVDIAKRELPVFGQVYI